MGIQETLRYLETLLFLKAYERAWPRQERPEEAQDSFTMKAGWQTCLGGVAYPHGTTKGTEAESSSLQQVLSGTTEDFGPLKKEASLWPGSSGQL